MLTNNIFVIKTNSKKNNLITDFNQLSEKFNGLTCFDNIALYTSNK